MATYVRTVSRITSDATRRPAWREAMTQMDCLYYVTAVPAGWTGNTLNKPLPTHFGASDEDVNWGAGWDVISGYSSGTLLEDVGGPWGTMVFGTGGHTRLQNQLLGMNLSQDVPGWSWWQQPMFKTSATRGAELYYNPSEFEALPPNRIILPNDSIANWDGRFPVGFDGWIYPDKMVTGQMGDNGPHGFRYSSTCFVPASVTGGDSLYFATLGPQGPFAQSWRPGDSSNSAWLKPEALFDGDQGRRLPYYFRNTSTGAWSEHKWQPAYQIYGFVQQQCAVFRDSRRIYVSGDRGNGTAGWWYIDMSNGMANHKVSSRFEPAVPVAPNRAACGAWTDSHPQGKHLAFWPDLLNATGLIVQDFDSNVQAALNIGKGLNVPANEGQVGMSYDPANNRIIMLLQDREANELFYYSIGIPPDHLDASRYTVSRRTLTLSDPVMADQLTDATGFYGKTRLHPTLGVILVPFARSRMLGFAPSA
jgi:hypothetical protein